MEPIVDLPKLNAEIEAWVARFQEMAQRSSGDTRQVLHSIVEQVREGQKQFNVEYAKAEAEIRDKVADVQAQARATMNAAEEIKAQAAQAARDAAAYTPPVPPPPKIDDALGGVLRDELMARYGKRAAAAERADDRLDEGSIATHWSPDDADEGPPPGETPPTPKPPQAPRKEAPRPDDDRISHESVGGSEWEE